MTRSASSSARNSRRVSSVSEDLLVEFVWRIVYPLLYTVLMLLYLPWQWLREWRGGGIAAPVLQRAGFDSKQLAALSAKPRPRLWVHAVSVGEVNVVKPLLERLDLKPDQLFVSTITTTGQELARRLYGERASLFYFPLDWAFSCRRYLRAIDPDAVLLAETELWPGFIRAAGNRAVPLVLVNGRLSDRAFRRYRRIRFLLRPLWSRFERFCVQSRQDRERILELGAPEARINLMGNLKYDYQLEADPEKQQLVERLQRLLKPHEGDLLWVCGSTREREEALLLPVFAQLRERFPQLRLLLAPRHPHRGEEIVEAARKRWSCIRRSEWPAQPVAGQTARPSPDVFVLDTIGELSHLYEIADVVFIGGSLVPWGGHNIIEAAHFSQPILFGPHMQNFREIAETFVQRYAALQVQSPEELRDRLTGLLEDPAARRWLGRNARKVIRDNQGAVERTAEVIEELLGRRGA